MTDTGERQESAASNVWQVTGPPGTGKTTWIARNAKLAIEKHGPARVLVASLTRAAAFEFASRGLGKIPRGQLGTLHSIAMRALGSPQLAEGEKGIKLWNEHVKSKFPSFQLTPSALRGDRETAMRADDSTGNGVLEAIQTVRHRFPCEVRNGGTEFLLRKGVGLRGARFHVTWEEWKKENEFMDFTDLIEACLTETERAPGNPIVMFGDEAQDWSRLEVMLFRDHWGLHAEKVILVGDPDQAIFDWRGADPRIFLDAPPSGPVPESQKILLSQSYRVPRAVHGKAVGLLRRTIADRADPEYLPRDFEGLAATLRCDFRNVDAILRLIPQCERAGETMMVMGTCGYMLHPLLIHMRRLGIPFANPYRAHDRSWNPLTRGEQIRRPGQAPPITKLDRVIALLRGTPAVGTPSEWSWHDIHAWASQLPAAGENAVLVHGAKAHLSRLARGEFGHTPGRYTMAEFGALFVGGWDGPYAGPAHKGDFAWWLESLPEEGREKYKYIAAILKSRGPAALIEPPRVYVGTIHSFKGGEADNVIVYPDLSAAGHKMEDSRSGRASLARLFYVALTRARKRAMLCEPYGREYFRDLGVGRWQTVKIEPDGESAEREVSRAQSGS